MNTLIIAEKPSVALRIAMALGNNKQKRIANGKTGYFRIDDNESNSTLYIAPAVGHLFTIRQVGSARGYPVLDVEWAPSYQANKSSAFTKQYLDTIMEVAKKCDFFINACDYDTEGTVIGTNLIKAAVNVPAEKLGEHAKRMKFSTTTTKDLVEAFANLSELDLDNFYAGEARHMLDWLWGINLSRALTYALGSTGGGKPLSVGRVQGPTLALLAKRELEINSFVPKPFWRVSAQIEGIEFTNSRGDIFDKGMADAAFKETESNAGNAVVKEFNSSEDKRWPYPPFDLTSLQLEASRVFRLDPTMTLAIAQKLYERSYISYPRTSSQKLPYSLGLPKIIEALGEMEEYSEIAKELIRDRRFKPLEGKKVDEAHPAIFPTGVKPKDLAKQEEEVYDLVARRFLSCFAAPAKVARIKIGIGIGKESYSASGAKVVEKGWLDYYKFASIEEKEVHEFKVGAVHRAEDIKTSSLETKPPKRYSKASLIAELERRGLGTKATRANIVDTLFRRSYVEGTSLGVTSFGMSVYNALLKNCPMIVEESTTKALEEDMELIVKGKKTEDEVLDEGKKMLLQALEMFDKNKAQVTQQLRSGFLEASVLGKCPKDGGDLIIRRSHTGKQFVACANYPNCTNTYPLVQKAKIVPTGRVCEYCHTPIVKVIRKGMRPFEMDLDPQCPHRMVTFKSKEQAPEKGGAETGASKGGEVKADEKRRGGKPVAVKPAKKPRKQKLKKTMKKQSKKGAKNEDRSS